MHTVSVVICAYTLDRWTDLVASVHSAADQVPGPHELILVIDHNPNLLARAQRELGGRVDGLRVLPSERKKGLSGARNTALETATGDVVVFLDDDASAEPGWLAALMAPYTSPCVVAVGGTATPRWPEGTARPVTLPVGDHGRGVLDWVVGCTYDGQPTSRGVVRNLMGCNMSMLREAAVAAGGFSEDLGRVGRTPLGCEETELCIRMHQQDSSAQILFEPAAGVRHRVSRDRLTWDYLMRRGYAEGLSKAVVATLVGKGAALETERGYVARVLPRAVVRGLAGAVRPGPVGRGRSLAGSAAVLAGLVATTAGYVRGRAAVVVAGVRGRRLVGPSAHAIESRRPGR